MKVFITKPIPQSAIQHLEENGLEVAVNRSGKKLSKGDLIQQVLQHDTLILVGNQKLDADFLDQCKHLQAIALTTVGYDHVDLIAADRLNIPISNTAGSLSATTADIAFLLMLATSRKAFFHAFELRKEKKTELEFMEDLGIELDGKTLGIFGLGSIGVEFAKKAKAAYGMQIIYHNRNKNSKAAETVEARYVSFDELLSQSDVLSVHANLSTETTNKFDKHVFRKMKNNAIFINTARGKIHVEADLIQAIQEGEIWGAGLDVSDPEPMRTDNPLLRMPTVCVLPHIGSATMEARTRMALMAAHNIIAASNGRPLPQRIKSI